MGLLSWLTRDLSEIGEGGGIGKPPGAMSGGGDETAMPPIQMTGMDAPPPIPQSRNQPFIDATNQYQTPGGMPEPMPVDPMAGPAPSLPAPSMNGPIPLPRAKPPGLGGYSDPSADGMPAPNSMGAPTNIPLPRPSPVALPPNAAQQEGVGMPGTSEQGGLGLMDQIQSRLNELRRNGGTPGEGGAQAQSFLGRALGMNPNQENSLSGALAAGFTAAGNSAGKSPMQAFATGVGASMEGGKKADDETTAKQQKYLDLAIKAKREGNREQEHINLMRFRIEQEKHDLEIRRKAAENKATGKDSVLNSPEQLYFKAIGATNADRTIRESEAHLKLLGTQNGVDSKEYKTAREEHLKLVNSTKEMHIKREGLDPEKVKGMPEQPGFSEKNPVKELGKNKSEQKQRFDALPVGAYFINPENGGIHPPTRKDGTPNPKAGQPWLLIKRGTGTQPAANLAQPQRQSPLASITPPQDFSNDDDSDEA
jgi:hypothetical protein